MSVRFNSGAQMHRLLRLVCAGVAIIGMSFAAAPSFATPSVVNIRLLPSEKDLAVDTFETSGWYQISGSPAYTKYVVAGSVITLVYEVTDGSGNLLTNQSVSLRINNADGGERAKFTTVSGGALALASAPYGFLLSGQTDSNGRVSFSVKNNDSPSLAESIRSVANVWSSPTNNVELKGGFYPSVDAATVNIDRFWPHFVKSSAPDAPTSVAATRGNGQATVSWTAPADHGSTITGYTIRAIDSGGTQFFATASASSRSATFPSLTNGQTYQMSLRATNVMGDSSWSTAVPVVPSRVSAKVPAAPAASLVSVGSRWVKLAYSAGADTGSTIIGAEYSIDAGATWASASASPITISGLTNGTKYSVRIRMTNGVGSGAAKAVSAKPIADTNAIRFTALSSMALGSNDQKIVATSSGGSVLVVSTTTKVCTIVNGAVHAVTVGTCALKATGTGDLYYSAPAAVTQSFTVTATVPDPVPSILSQNCTASYMWCDDFNGSSISSANWEQINNDGCTTTPSQCGFGNNEYQWYSPTANTLASNTVNGVSDNSLVITSTPLGTPKGRCQWSNNSCTWNSGKLTTLGKVGFMYGKIEASIKMPAGTGTLPAFWMLGADFPSVGWPRTGEIDIVEAPARTPRTVFTTLHLPSAADGTHIQYPMWDCSVFCNQFDHSAALSADFHTYGLEWYPGRMDFFFDGRKIKTVTKASVEAVGGNWVFDNREFFLMLNVAVNDDDNFVGHITSATNGSQMKVAYVRYAKVTENGNRYGTLTLH